MRQRPVLLYTLLFSLAACRLFMYCNTTERPEVQSMDSIYLSYDHVLVPYAFYDPDTAYQLADRLREISALTYVSENELAAVEDEHGIVYIISTEGEIVREIEFGENEDYEGIEFWEGKYYVMDSDGDLTQFPADDTDQARSEGTKIKGGNDSEGLGIWQGTLLVACKGSGDAGDFNASGKGVYSMDPDTGDLLDLVIEVDEDDLEEIIQKRHPDLDITDFDPSAVAVNPIDDTIYLLSADMIVAIFSSSGELKEVIPLFSSMYRQPEGIAFAPDGTLFIASEGAGKAGQLFRLSRKK